jgi:hypothetical protein
VQCSISRGSRWVVDERLSGACGDRPDDADFVGAEFMREGAAAGCELVVVGNRGHAAGEQLEPAVAVGVIEVPDVEDRAPPGGRRLRPSITT